MDEKKTEENPTIKKDKKSFVRKEHLMQNPFKTHQMFQLKANLERGQRR